MTDPKLCANFESSSNTIHDSVSPHLFLQLNRKITRQVYLARYHVHGLEPRLLPLLQERTQPLGSDQPVMVIKLNAQGLEREINFSIRVREVRQESDIAIEVRRRVEVDAVEPRPP